jgi:hypothetical protein
MSDDLFDNGIDGEPFESPADDYHEEENYREDFDVCNANGLEVKGWPTYGNYTIITSLFHVYYWPGSDTLEIHSKDPNASCAGINDRLLLTLKNHNLSFFGDEELPDEDGRVGVTFYTGEQINQKIQRYLNLKAFL